MGLLTKLNALTVGLIVLTAVVTTGFYLWQQWNDADQQLRDEAATIITMLGELSQRGMKDFSRGLCAAGSFWLIDSNSRNSSF